MREIASWIASAAAAVILCAVPAQASQPFIADDPQDLGAEPNPTSSTTASPDIWVRRDPDPNYNPAPFDAANPSWTPLPHQNPRHADPRLSEPNWVYVRVRNRGSGPTPAGARLKRGLLSGSGFVGAAAKRTSTWRFFSPERMITSSVWSALPASSKRSVWAPGSMGIAVPSSSEATVLPSTFTRTPRRSEPAPSCA